jgi:hypothetical protein
MFRFLTQQLTGVKCDRDAGPALNPPKAARGQAEGFVSQLISGGRREQDNRDR